MGDLRDQIPSGSAFRNCCARTSIIHLWITWIWEGPCMKKRQSTPVNIQMLAIRPVLRLYICTSDAPEYLLDSKKWRSFDSTSWSNWGTDWRRIMLPQQKIRDPRRAVSQHQKWSDIRMSTTLPRSAQRQSIAGCTRQIQTYPLRPWRSNFPLLLRFKLALARVRMHVKKRTGCYSQPPGPQYLLERACW